MEVLSILFALAKIYLCKKQFQKGEGDFYALEFERRLILKLEKINYVIYKL